jgi:uncharacterized membrane protein
MPRAATVMVTVLAVIGLAVYGWFSHLLTMRDDRSGAEYFFSLGSVYLLIVALAWPTRWRRSVAVAATLLAVAAWAMHWAFPWDPRWLNLFQHAGTNACLGVLFGRTLVHGRRPLVTRFALAVHGTLPPGMDAYTRAVTWAWTVFFAVLTGCSLVLFFSGHAYWWSVLANFLTLPAVGLMFLGEYWVRRQRFPKFEHASLLDGIRAFSRTF